MKYLLVVIGILFSMCVWANELPSKKVTMEAKTIGAKDALVALLKDSGLKYNLSGEVKNEKIVSLQAKDIPWNQLFKVILDQAHLTYKFDDKGILQISKM